MLKPSAIRSRSVPIGSFRCPTDPPHGIEKVDLESPWRHVAILQAQILDYVVEVNEDSVVAHIQERYDLETDAEGLASVWLPPGAKVCIHCQPPSGATWPEAAEAPLTVLDAHRQVAVSARRQQFVGFELQQLAQVQVYLREFGTNLPISGATIRFIMTHDERGEDVERVLGDHLTRDNGQTDWIKGHTGTLVRADIVHLPGADLVSGITGRVSDVQTPMLLA